ncbi:response regulator [Rhodopirellula sp. SWK7]|uniref:response regulator n=1 Tax=Rhodopirellula sp. SWK7 TaxID=595460 RepID=UPI0002BFB03E|nr:response regulator [Rhodopirellula sp. SWK7]EMI41380.1 Signal transduction response regulator, receiver region domain protein [Rhodopirellula sp. SWK7]
MFNSKGRVLVVEDDEAIRLGLQIRLQSHGLLVFTATNGREALTMVPSVQPDVILMDIRMPLMDGLIALRELKMNPETQTIPVIMLSASPGDQNLALDSGAARFIRKPFVNGELLETIDLCLQQDHPAATVCSNNSCITEMRADSAETLVVTHSQINPVKSMKILLIEDDVAFADVVDVKLTACGHEVVVAHNWLSVMRKLKSFQPDLVLADIETPTGNGLTAFEFLNSDESVRAIPKAFVTGRTDDETRRRCEMMGAKHISKSNRVMEDIMDLVDAHCGSSNLNQVAPV